MLVPSILQLFWISLLSFQTSFTISFVLTRNPQHQSLLKCENNVQETLVATPKQILHFLTTRYGNDGDWTRARNYVYRAKLTMKQVEEVTHFLEETFPASSTNEVAAIIQSSPRILRKNTATYLMPTATFLQDLYGDRLFREAIGRNPNLLLVSGLGYNNAHHTEDVECFLHESFNMSKAAVKKLKKSAPFVFSRSLSPLQDVTSFLTSQLLKSNQTNVPKATRWVSKLLLGYPQLFYLSVDSNLEPRIEFLRESCNLNDEQIASLLYKAGGSILGLSVEDNLKPKLEFLFQLLQAGYGNGRHTDIKGNLLKKCILSHASILGLSLSNLEQKVHYFSTIDHGCKELAARIAVRSPAVYSLSLSENLYPTLNFLSKIWGVEKPPSLVNGTSNLLTVDSFERKQQNNSRLETLSGMLLEYPGILTLSLEGNIQPTLRFFNQTGYTMLDEDWNVLENVTRIRGRYIAASLFGRLLPRYHYATIMKQPSSTGSQEEEEFAQSPSLHILVSCTDEDFCAQKNLNLTNYTAFRKQESSRLKFSSQFDTWLQTGRAIDKQ